MKKNSLSHKQQLQENEYELPAHWLLEHTTRVQYARLSDVISFHIARHLQRGKLLDLGCGDGKGTIDLKERLDPSSFITEGADYSEKAILLARAMTYGSGVTFTVADITQSLETKFKAADYDCIVLREVIEHIKEDGIEAALSEVSRILSNKGILIVTTPSTQKRVNKKHYQHYTPQLLTMILTKNGFDIIDLLGFGFWPIDLSSLKHIINSIPKVWHILNPLWRQVTPSRAMTLVAIAQKIN